MNNWKGSKIDFSRIKIMKEYEKSIDEKVWYNVVYACYTYSNSEITIFWEGIKSLTGNKQNKQLRLIAQSFFHESLHGVIASIMKQSKLPFRIEDDLKEHWPFLHGLDPYYKWDYHRGLKIRNRKK